MRQIPIFFRAILVSHVSRIGYGQSRGHWPTQRGKCDAIASLLQAKGLLDKLFVECDNPEGTCTFSCANQRKPKIRQTRCICKDRDLNFEIFLIEDFKILLQYFHWNGHFTSRIFFRQFLYSQILYRQFLYRQFLWAIFIGNFAGSANGFILLINLYYEKYESENINFWPN